MMVTDQVCARRSNCSTTDETSDPPFPIVSFLREVSLSSDETSNLPYIDWITLRIEGHYSIHAIIVNHILLDLT